MCVTAASKYISTTSSDNFRSGTVRGRKEALVGIDIAIGSDVIVGIDSVQLIRLQSLSIGVCQPYEE